MAAEDLSVTEINEMYKCGICIQTFGRFQDLKRHMESHDRKYAEKKYFKCNHCGQKFYKIHHLQEHVKEFNKVTVTYVEIKCPIMDFQVETFANYLTNNSVEFETPSTSDPSGLDNFISWANDTEGCGDGFDDLLVESMDLNFDDNKNFVKEEDTKDFDLNNNEQEVAVQEEMEEHQMNGGEETQRMIEVKKEVEEVKTPAISGEERGKKAKKFSCDKCAYSTHAVKLLKAHVKAIHERIKPYKCPDCEWSFSQATPLKNHIRAKHKGERPYGCQYCDYRATQKGPMIYHTKAKHTNDRTCVCVDCSKAFPRNDVLKKHRLTKHGSV